MKICTIMAEGFEESEFTTVYDLFKRARMDVDVFSASGESAASSHGLTYAGLQDIARVKKEDYDLLYVPGGRRNYEALRQRQDVKDLLQYFLAEKKLAIICASPAILGEMGLLKDRTYTLFPSFYQESFGGTFLNQYTVKDGNLYTGRSMAASVELGLLVIQDNASKEILEHVKQGIQY